MTALPFELHVDSTVGFPDITTQYIAYAAPTNIHLDPESLLIVQTGVQLAHCSPNGFIQVLLDPEYAENIAIMENVFKQYYNGYFQVILHNLTGQHIDIPTTTKLFRYTWFGDSVANDTTSDETQEPYDTTQLETAEIPQELTPESVQEEPQAESPEEAVSEVSEEQDLSSSVLQTSSVETDNDSNSEMQVRDSTPASEIQFDAPESSSVYYEPSVINEEESKDDPMVVEEESKNEPIVAEEESKNEPIVAEEESKDEPMVAEEESKNEPMVAEEESKNELIVAEEESKDEPMVAEVPVVAESPKVAKKRISKKKTSYI